MSISLTLISVIVPVLEMTTSEETVFAPELGIVTGTSVEVNVVQSVFPVVKL